MTDIAAAIGLAQLEKLDGFNASRQKNAAMLSEGLKAFQELYPQLQGKVIPTFFTSTQ